MDSIMYELRIDSFWDYHSYTPHNTYMSTLRPDLSLSGIVNAEHPYDDIWFLDHTRGNVHIHIVQNIENRGNVKLRNDQVSCKLFVTQDEAEDLRVILARLTENRISLAFVVIAKPSNPEGPHIVELVRDKKEFSFDYEVQSIYRSIKYGKPELSQSDDDVT